MNFFELGPRQDYARYWPEETSGEIAENRIPEDSRKAECLVREYLGDPPRKPGKRGSFHRSAYSFFIRDDALSLFSSASQGLILTNPARIVGRERETFHQIWVTNFVDCLDLAKTSVSPSVSRRPGKVGVIKRPVFDENRWDGSDLFVVPQDPSYCFFCSEKFVAQWQAAGFKGAIFSKHLMDRDAICA